LWVLEISQWGKYERSVRETDGEYRVPIQRIYCIKCRRTYSYLPSFCVSKICYSANFTIKILSALILRIKFELEDMKRHAYTVLKRFVRLENLWLTYLRTKGCKDFPTDKKERTVKIFTALLKLNENQNLISNFFSETGRHFMSLK
jgi:hypothetical protein